ncbi:MAG: Uncharacterised protein [Euryarchaeota archaeon UBA443]|nr:MAG: Uncharacterised protein [Euryarchaeota archaeon UBA443]
MSKMFDSTGSGFNKSSSIAQRYEDQTLPSLWKRSKNSIQIQTGGFRLKVPDSIMRQAKDTSLPVTIRIGKSGLTDAVIVELNGQLSSRSLVKAKVNRGLFEREDLKKVWSHLAEQTSSHLIFARGNVAVFWNK